MCETEATLLTVIVVRRVWEKEAQKAHLFDTITDPWFDRGLDYSASHLVRNIGNMKCEDRDASLFSGERVLFRGIYVVGI